MSRWVPVGPSCAPNTQAGGRGDATARTTVAGRVQVLAMDPRAPTTTVFAGTQIGGLWRTLDGGAAWEPVEHTGASITALAVAPSGRLWVGSELGVERFLLARSEDAGSHFTDFPFAGAVRAILPDPRDERFVFLAVESGIGQKAAVLHGPHETGDAFRTIVRGQCSSLAAALDAATGKVRLYAAFNGAWLSAGDPDVGLTPLPKPPGLTDVSRVLVAVAASNPNVVYAVAGGVDRESPVQGLFRSPTAGQGWERVGPLAPGQEKPMGNQTIHNLALAVHPRDPDVVLVGEVHLWRSTNGGQTFTDVSQGKPPIHVDQLCLAFDPAAGADAAAGERPGDRGVLWAGNDGGIFLSRDGGRTFRHRNRGLQTMMLFQIAHHPVVPSVVLAGALDNGVQRGTGHVNWRELLGGDGTSVAIDQTLPAGTPDLARYRIWYSAIFADLMRSTSAGEPNAWVDVFDDEALDFTPIEPDRLEPKIAYWGHKAVLQVSVDRDLDPTTKGRQRTLEIFTSTDGVITALCMSRDGRVMYVGTARGRTIFRLVREDDAWSDRTPAPTAGRSPPGGNVTSIAIDPADSNHVYFGYAYPKSVEGTTQHLWQSFDGGAAWAPVPFDPSAVAPDGRRPEDNPVNALAIDPQAPHILYVGCDSGVFAFDSTAATGAQWSTWWKGLPATNVNHLQIHERARLLRAATYGRGLWERPLGARDTDPDPATPETRVYLRTHRYDDGRRPPLNQSGEDPLDRSRRYGPLDGADIKVDIDPVLLGDFQKPASTVDYTPGGPIDHIGFQALDNRTPRHGRDARIYVQVNNAGPDVAAQVKVRVFWSAHGSTFAPLTPALWAAFASDGEPASGDWHAAGPPQLLTDLRPAEPQIARITWSTPSDGADEIALLAVVGTPAAAAEPTGAPDQLLHDHAHFSLKQVSLDQPLYNIIGALLVGVGLAAGITYALVKDPPAL